MSPVLGLVALALAQFGLIGWLRRQPMCVSGDIGGNRWLMVHAGLLPQWTAAKAVALLELISDTLPTDAKLVASCLYDRLDRGSHEAEVKAPFRGFMLDAPSGDPIMALGKTIDVSFSVEASSEFAAGGEWASDTADPIVGYELGSAEAGVTVPMRAAPAALFVALAAVALWMARRGGGNIFRSKEFTREG